MPYRTKTRVIKAFCWTGQPREEWPEWATISLVAESGSALYTYTKNGPVRVTHGCWVILGDGECYPCTDDEFHKRYEEIPADTIVSEATLQGNFDSTNLRYNEKERASKSGAPLSGDLDAPHTWSPNDG